MKKTMVSQWILLHNIPPSGKSYTLDDQEIWTVPMAEFGISGVVREPIRAELTVFVQEDGILVRGALTGVVALECNRCAEDAVVVLDQRVESYESFPDDVTPDADLDVDREVVRYAPTGQGTEINLAALAWEEFLLALPMKPLCEPGCKGLCPQCGVNKNQASCSCETDAADPRMAPLRGLKVGR